MQVTLTTASGQSLAFEPFDFYSNWNPVGGLYAFAYYNYASHRWHILYIGKAVSFQTRLTDNHEKWSPAVDLGASVVLACVLDHELVRRVWEQALIERYQPVLNIQHNPMPVGLGAYKDRVYR
jgi:hypothetical protein